MLVFASGFAYIRSTRDVMMILSSFVVMVNSNLVSTGKIIEAPHVVSLKRMNYGLQRVGVGIILRASVFECPTPSSSNFEDNSNERVQDVVRTS